MKIYLDQSNSLIFSAVIIQLTLSGDGGNGLTPSVKTHDLEYLPLPAAKGIYLRRYIYIYNRATSQVCNLLSVGLMSSFYLECCGNVEFIYVLESILYKLCLFILQINQCY